MWLAGVVYCAVPNNVISGAATMQTGSLHLVGDGRYTASRISLHIARADEQEHLRGRGHYVAEDDVQLGFWLLEARNALESATKRAQVHDERHKRTEERFAQLLHFEGKAQLHFEECERIGAEIAEMERTLAARGRKRGEEWRVEAEILLPTARELGIALFEENGKVFVEDVRLKRPEYFYIHDEIVAVDGQRINGGGLAAFDDMLEKAKKKSEGQREAKTAFAVLRSPPSDAQGAVGYSSGSWLPGLKDVLKKDTTCLEATWRWPAQRVRKHFKTCCRCAQCQFTDEDHEGDDRAVCKNIDDLWDRVTRASHSPRAHMCLCSKMRFDLASNARLGAHFPFTALGGGGEGNAEERGGFFSNFTFGAPLFGPGGVLGAAEEGRGGKMAGAGRPSPRVWPAYFGPQRHLVTERPPTAALSWPGLFAVRELAGGAGKRAGSSAPARIVLNVPLRARPPREAEGGERSRMRGEGTQTGILDAYYALKTDANGAKTAVLAAFGHGNKFLVKKRCPALPAPLSVPELVGEKEEAEDEEGKITKVVSILHNFHEEERKAAATRSCGTVPQQVISMTGQTWTVSLAKDGSSTPRHIIAQIQAQQSANGKDPLGPVSLFASGGHADDMRKKPAGIAITIHVAPMESVLDGYIYHYGSCDPTFTIFLPEGDGSPGERLRALERACQKEWRRQGGKPAGREFLLNYDRTRFFQAVPKNLKFYRYKKLDWFDPRRLQTPDNSPRAWEPELTAAGAAALENGAELYAEAMNPLSNSSSSSGRSGAGGERGDELESESGSEGEADATGQPLALDALIPVAEAAEDLPWWGEEAVGERREESGGGDPEESAAPAAGQEGESNAALEELVEAGVVALAGGTEGGEEKKERGRAGEEEIENEEQAPLPPLKLFLMEEALTEEQVQRGVKPRGDVVEDAGEGGFRDFCVCREAGDRWGAYVSVVPGEERIDAWAAIDIAEEGAEAAWESAVELLGGEGEVLVVEREE
jgi:hypothetical protein